MHQNPEDDQIVELDEIDTGHQSGSGIIVMPIKIPVDRHDLKKNMLRETEYDDSEVTSLKDQLGRSTIAFYGVYEDPQETVDAIIELSEDTIDLSTDDSLVRAAQCGAYWRSIGAETVIYMTSFGGVLIANGLLIRFADISMLPSTLAAGALASALFPNSRILFESLIKPPKDYLPDDKRSTFDALNKYAFLPMSWMVKAVVIGGTLAALEDTSFGTQQVVGSLMAMAVGPVTIALRGSTRSCLKGSIILKPEYEGVTESFKTAYSDKPNQGDGNRSHRWGMARDVFLRGLALSSSTLALFLSNGIAIQNYCIGGKSELEQILANNGTITNDDINSYCAGGSVTYMFRELGFSFSYAVGMMVLEPILNTALNKVYDYFYPPTQDDQQQ